MTSRPIKMSLGSVFCLLMVTTVILCGFTDASVFAHIIREYQNPVYPYFRQCDPQWGSDRMGLQNCSIHTCAGATLGRDTVCNEGCAMSCLSMALNAYGYKVDNKLPDPGALNQWLVENSGYECLDGNCNNLALKQVKRLIYTALSGSLVRYSSLPSTSQPWWACSIRSWW